MHLYKKVLVALFCLIPLLTRAADLDTFKVGTADFTVTSERVVLLESDPAVGKHGITC